MSSTLFAPLRCAPALASLLVALSAALPLGSAQAQTPGASASGYAWGDFVIGCTTCPHIAIPLSGSPDGFAGGDGYASASLSYAGTPVRTGDFAAYTLSGRVSYAAAADFTGSLQTPLLGAMAFADNEQAFIIVQPDVPVGIDLYQASAVARTQMLYTFLGAAPASYTFHFSLTGVVSNDQSSLFGSAALYSGPTTDFEIGLIDAGSAWFQGTGVNDPPHAVAGSFSVSVLVNPGDSFWMVSQLSALASMTYSSADVLVDGMHTLQVTAIDGDLGLLVAAPVPEPGTWALFSLGLIAFSTGALRRRAAS